MKGDFGDFRDLAAGLAALETGTGFEEGTFSPVGTGFDNVLDATGVAESPRDDGRLKLERGLRPWLKSK